MICPVCEGKVRVAYCFPEKHSVIRKRQCCECGHIFYTSEIEHDMAEDIFHQLQSEKEIKRKIQKFKERMMNKK